MENNILITGATGNVGSEIIKVLFKNNTCDTIIAGVRNIKKSESYFSKYPDLQYRIFDFEDKNSFSSALENIDILFLLRPPHISDVELFFRPLIETAYEKGIRKVVFLSVQGAEKTHYIPHAKIEKMIVESGMEYIFLRPSYFMQNLTTTLSDDIKSGTIMLPAGKARFNWIDIQDIAEFSVSMFVQFEKYKNQGFEITGQENVSFPEVVQMINEQLKTNLTYKSPNLIRFFRYKKRAGVPVPMILVMIMLHYLPRFQKAPHISDNYEKIVGKQPTLLKEFIEREKGLF